MLTESLETTQVYTHVAIGKLAEIHAATHPSARLNRRDGETLDHEEARLSGRVYQRRNPLAPDVKEDVLAASIPKKTGNRLDGRIL